MNSQHLLTNERAGSDRGRRWRGPDRVDAPGPPRGRASARQRASRRRRICPRRMCSTSGRWRCWMTSVPRRRSRSGARPRSRWRRRRTTRASRVRTPTTDIGSRDWSPGALVARMSCWRAASPWRQMNLPQIRLEPLLKARAEELSPGRIRFNHELIDLDQDDDGVRALIRDNASGREYVVRCEYLLGADGGRLVHRLIGVEYEGLGVVTQTATLHVSADFSRMGEGSRRADPLDLLAPERRAGGDGPDGTRALGSRLRGVGDPPELPGRLRRDRRSGRSRRPQGAGHRGSADGDPQDHAVVGRGGDRLCVPRRARVPAGRRGTSPPADRRAWG